MTFGIAAALAFSLVGCHTAGDSEQGWETVFSSNDGGPSIYPEGEAVEATVDDGKSEYRGIAKNTDRGAAVQTKDGPVYIDGLGQWPEEYQAQQVTVRGLPAVQSGAPGQQSMTRLKDADWSR
jgi:hypothetical protein